MGQGIIIAGFKAIGKSTLAKKYKNVVDVDSSNYKYIIDSKLDKLSEEERKGVKSRIVNPEYPNNYYNEIIKQCKSGKLVLIACKKEILQMLEKAGNEFFIVYPKESMLDEIIERAKNRGNGEDFISNIKNAYYRDFPNENQKVIWIKSGEYLEDIMLKNDLFEFEEI